jgi:hypothetical protein
MLGRKKRIGPFFYPYGDIGLESQMYPQFVENFFVRQHPAPLPPHYYAAQGMQNWYPNQPPYGMNGNQFPNVHPNFMGSTNAYAPDPNMMNHVLPQSLLENPLQPMDDPYPSYSPQQMYGAASLNPYPAQSVMPKSPSGMQSLLNSFKSQDGSVDFTKMINTAGQMVNAISQVSSMVKGLGGILKA